MYKDTTYLNSAFVLGDKGFLLNVFQSSFYALELTTQSAYLGPFIVMILTLFLLVEIYLIVRSIRLKKLEQSSWGKLCTRFFVNQLLSVVTGIAAFFAIPLLSFCILFCVAYVDLKIHTPASIEGVITNDSQIIQKIKESSSLIDVYDSAGNFGTVLARRNLKKESKLSIYSSTILPLVAKFAPQSGIKTTYFLPQNNTLVYTYFEKDTSDKIIIELAFNHLKNNPDPLIVAAYKAKKPPAVAYLNNDEYAPYMKQKRIEIDASNLAEYRKTIKINENVVSICKLNDASNYKLIAEQEADYQKNCVALTRYVDCPAFRQKIDENKAITESSAKNCRVDTALLNEQYKDIEERVKEATKRANAPLLFQQDELSNGMYFYAPQQVYMRVISHQDSFVYLSTLHHELLHHYSGIDDTFPNFMIEGMTDFLSLRSFGLSDYEIAGGSTYSREVQVAMALMERIPQEELEKVYFGTSSATFESLFKQYFSNIDYNEFLKKGNQLFDETYLVSGPTLQVQWWQSTTIDQVIVQDMRGFLGLGKTKFLK